MHQQAQALQTFKCKYQKSKGTQTHLGFASFALFFCSESRNNIYKYLFSHVSYICKVFTVICTANRKSWLLQSRFQAPLDILFVIRLFRPIFLSKCHDFYCQVQQPINRCSLGENNYTNDHNLIITYKKDKIVYLNTFATAHQGCCNFEVKRTHNWPRVNYDRGKY